MTKAHTHRGPWSLFNTFGLRKEWVALYLDHPERWEETGALGNRQIEAFKRWIKVCELEDKSCSLFSLFQSSTVNNLMPWEIAWANIAANLATASWYVKELGFGTWKTTELRNILEARHPHLAQRTVTNAINELTGLLERTPIGKELCQGLVENSRPRTVTRKGLAAPSREAVFYALYHLFLENKTDCLDLDSDDLWPWVIFGCRKNYVLQKVILEGDRWFRLTDRFILLKEPVATLEEVYKCGFILTT